MTIDDYFSDYDNAKICADNRLLMSTRWAEEYQDERYNKINIAYNKFSYDRKYGEPL